MRQEADYRDVVVQNEKSDL